MISSSQFCRTLVCRTPKDGSGNDSRGALVVQPASRGLRDVEVVESSITAITPEGLFYRGHSLETVLEHATFEELAFVLWHDRRPTRDELTSFRGQYLKSWLLPAEVIPTVTRLNPAADPLLALQVAIPFLALADLERDDPSPAARHRGAVRLLAQAAAVVACRHWGMPVGRLDPAAPLGAQVMRALGAKALPARVADAALILYADHELAASTFAARIAAAAHSGLHDGVGAGLAVLKGPLHGGSTMEVANMLRRIAEASHFPTAIDRLLGSGGRVPGFGHTVYRSGDPRAAHFHRLADQTATGEARRWLEVAEILEERILLEQRLYANVDLYGAVFMHAAGFRDNAMVAFFAVARIAGWIAHMLEQSHNNRLIRPRARWTGVIGRGWDA